MIELINVSKRFRIYEDRSRDLKETAINLLRGKKRSFRDLWALKDINLIINEGETVGFIGENGSGKSTLLKLICGIYSPDRGRIRIEGKVSALLELGVGFHPDLTGEENIYLNGSMLGFERKAMKERFKEIVEFSELGDFIYSPIRTYSSGMVMRLGFSIAMCVNPDILLIDEVLAVGDEAFQNKCLERLEAFKNRGKTIVLVSHSMEMVKKFCERAILFDEGRIIYDDLPEKTIKAYHAFLYGDKTSSNFQIDYKVQEKVGQIDNGLFQDHEKPVEEGDEPRLQGSPLSKRYGSFEAEIIRVLMRSEEGKETDTFMSGEIVSFCLLIRLNQDIENPNVGIAILKYEEDKPILFYSTNTIKKDINFGLCKKDSEMEITFIQKISLPEGKYYLTLAVTDPTGLKFYDWQENLNSFWVKKKDYSWDGEINLDSQIKVIKK